MLRKLTSILLSMAMLLMLFPSTVLGALPTNEFNVTDGIIATSTTGAASDNFDDKEITETAFKYYATNKATDVFYTWDKQNVAVFNIKSAENSANSNDKLLEVSSHNSGQAQLNSLKFNVQTDHVSQLTYDVRFTKIPSGTTIGASASTSYIFGYMGAGGIYLTYKTDKWVLNHPTGTSVQAAGVEITKDKWYTVRSVVTGTGALTSYLIDRDTEEVLLTANRSSALSGEKNFTAVYLPSGGTASDIILEVDNAEMVVYNQKNSRPSVSKSSIAESISSVPINTDSIEITFDQPIATAPSTVNITPAGGTAISAVVSKVSSKLNTYSVAITDALTGLKEHTVDLSGFINAGSLSADNYTFTTGAAYPVLLESTPASGAQNVSADTKSLSLTFDQAMTTYPVSVKLTGGSADISADITTSDNKTFTVSWTTDLEGRTTYTLSLDGFKNTSLQASLTDSLSFTTENTAIVTENDSFEESSLLSVNTVGYATKGQSPLTMPTTTSYGTDEGPADILTHVEHGTGNALSLKTGSTAGKTYLSPLRTYNTYSVAEGEKLVATWRFNLKQMGVVDDATKDGCKIDIGCSNATWLSFGNSMTMIYSQNGKPFINHTNDNAVNGTEISEDHWYNVVYVLESTNQIIYVVDSETGEIIYRREKAGKSNETIQPLTEEKPAYVYVYSGARTETKSDDKTTVTGVVNDSQEFLVDDFTMWRIKPEKDSQKLSLVSADENAVIKKDGKLSMTFNQPILANSGMFEVYKGTDKNELAYSTAKVKYTDFCTQEISFSHLDYLTNYTLDYSGITAVSGADLGAATASGVLGFSTEASPEDVSIVGDIAATGIKTGDTISFDLYSKNEDTVTLFAAFYKRGFPMPKLIGIEIEENVQIAAGTETGVSVTLSYDYDADSIIVYALDGVSTLKPLMSCRDIIAPADTMKVLMIGNSLSEDAQRYLNKVASAGGLTLDLTVKGIGGKTLADHAANLKAELEGNPIATYFTYENGVYQSATDGNKLLTDAFRDGEEYDIISLQQFSAYRESDFEEALPYLTEELRKLQPNAEIVLYQTWSPYSGDKETRNYYFKNTIEPALSKWAAYTGANVDNITLNGADMKIIPAGAAFYLADNKYDWCGIKYTGGDGNTDSDAKVDTTTEMNAAPGLWRDYNHAGYYGCYLADAVWYEMMTGRKAPVTDADGAPLVPAPTGVNEEEHLARLNELSNAAHQVVLEQND